MNPAFSGHKWHTTLIHQGHKRIYFSEYGLLLWSKPKIEVALVEPENAVCHIIKITPRRVVLELLSVNKKRFITGTIKWRLV